MTYDVGEFIHLGDSKCLIIDIASDVFLVILYDNGDVDFIIA